MDIDRQSAELDPWDKHFGRERARGAGVAGSAPALPAVPAQQRQDDNAPRTPGAVAGLEIAAGEWAPASENEWAHIKQQESENLQRALMHNLLRAAMLVAVAFIMVYSLANSRAESAKTSAYNTVYFPRSGQTQDPAARLRAGRQAQQAVWDRAAIFFWLCGGAGVVAVAFVAGAHKRRRKKSGAFLASPPTIAKRPCVGKKEIRREHHRRHTLVLAWPGEGKREYDVNARLFAAIEAGDVVLVAQRPGQNKPALYTPPGKAL